MTPLASLALEWLTRSSASAPPTAAQAAALLVTILGAALYSTGETTWTSMGLALLLANTALSALMATLEQQLTKAVSQTAPGLIIYRFAASMPPLLALSFALDDGWRFADTWPS